MFLVEWNKCIKLVSTLLCIFVVTWMWANQYVPIVAAQSDVLWSEPIQLSDPEIDAWAPAIAADKAGNVHVVWSQTMTTSEEGQGDTLYYVRWDGQEWTSPVDVLVSPIGGAEWPDLAVTPEGILHLVWRGTGGGGQESQLLYAWAPACCANHPAQWSKPVVLDVSIEANPAIVADNLGRLHVAYALQGSSAVAYLRSDDGGSTWSTPINLFGGTYQGDEYALWPRLAVAASMRVDLVWSVQPWPGRAVMYACSDDGGTTWNEPQVIDTASREDYASDDYGPIYIDVEANGRDEVHVIWDGAPTIERTHLWSSDGGETWSAMNFLFPEITGVGRAGWNDMAFDSDNILHAISMIAEGSPQHASWDGVHWSATDPIAMVGPATSGTHHVHLAISRGNTLHVVWQKKDEQPFSVWYVRGQSSAPELPIQALPEFASEPTVTKTEPDVLALSPSPTLQPQQYPENKPVRGGILVTPLFVQLLSLLSALVLVGITFIVFAWQKRAR